MRKPIAVTAGDPHGVGPEVAVKAVRRISPRKLKIVLVGEETSLRKSGWNSNLCPLINVTLKKTGRSAGRPSAAGGEISFKAFRLGVKLATLKKACALVTAPVSKESWRLAGIKLKGHSDYLRKKFAKETLMCFVRGNLRVALLTEHVALKNVPKHLREESFFRKIRLFKEALRRLGVRRPEICLASVNPHAGDGGMIGGEDELLKSALRRVRSVKGPYPADKAWLRHMKGEFDGLMAAYHDQGILPLKILAGGHDFVHWTHGLDFVRTSPAHGTAFDIAGKNAADPSSMINAVLFAGKLCGH